MWQNDRIDKEKLERSLIINRQTTGYLEIV